MNPLVNVVGIVGATTNMPSGTAMNPGDVVKAQNGKSIEIINTDAEGRLVLADCLSYAKRFDPDVVIDAATLTGACVIALGHTASGVFSSDDALIAEILAAGKRAGEPGWPLPRRCFSRNLPKVIRGRISTLQVPLIQRLISSRFPKDRRESRRVLSSSSFAGEFAEESFRALAHPSPPRPRGRGAFVRGCLSCPGTGAYAPD